jgi:hypothetical protein
VLELQPLDVRTGGIPPSPPSQTPAAATKVVEPPVPTAPASLPLVNPLAASQIQKARLR